MKANEQPLAPTLQAQLFELYLRGTTLEQIQRLNKHIQLGSIVRAFVEGDWYNRRLLYTEGVLDGIRLKVQQTFGEGADFLSDFLQVFHKLYGDKLKLFLQTGDESVLGDLKPTNLTQYRLVLDMLMNATGAKNTTTVKVNGEVNHRHESSTGVNPPVNTRMTSADAAKLLMGMQGLDTKTVDVPVSKPEGPSEG